MSEIDTRRAIASLAPQADTQARRSESARLAELIEHVEAAFERGVSREEVLARLHESGFTMSLHTFDKALYRIRKRRNPTRSVRRPADKATATPAQASNTRSEEVETETLSNGRTIKSAAQLRRENPTLPGVQISKLYAQQYADPVITMDELEEMKRKYNPPLIRR
ncbi:hypothetical protein [Paraburkholderia hospita]|jgi:hypothetical protein|uniref:hypothetical protein n=1 Tax=Paraburkholderia hospita TaxID=169430 RepID=UPI00027193EC|nr:hypothetical protein [Paraburkholderia hospita]EUC20947.1 hypothetical protein PMI06_009666 [Burkholderia sp. BT03]SKC57701.1 hypothetical protein SAMN06266956_0925 [Paraburkholderia hospita]